MPNSFSRKRAVTSPIAMANSEQTSRALSNLLVSEFTPLEDGYAVVKFDAEPRAEQTGEGLPIDLLRQRVPQISGATMLRLLPALAAAASEPNVAGKGRAQEQTERRVLPANKAFMDRMRAQELENRERDIENGTLLYSDAICIRLGMTRQSLSRAVRDGQVFALDGPSRKKLYPAFLADPAIDRERLAEVSRALGDLPGSSKYGFFVTPKLPLGGRTPLEVLVSGGDMKALLTAAAGFRER